MKFSELFENNKNILPRVFLFLSLKLVACSPSDQSQVTQPGDPLSTESSPVLVESEDVRERKHQSEYCSMTNICEDFNVNSFTTKLAQFIQNYEYTSVTISKEEQSVGIIYSYDPRLKKPFKDFESHLRTFIDGRTDEDYIVSCSTNGSTGEETVTIYIGVIDRAASSDTRDCHRLDTEVETL